MRSSTQRNKQRRASGWVQWGRALRARVCERRASVVVGGVGCSYFSSEGIETGCSVSPCAGWALWRRITARRQFCACARALNKVVRVRNQSSFSHVRLLRHTFSCGGLPRRPVSARLPVPGTWRDSFCLCFADNATSCLLECPRACTQTLNSHGVHLFVVTALPWPEICPFPPLTARPKQMAPGHQHATVQALAPVVQPARAAASEASP